MAYLMLALSAALALQGAAIAVLWIRQRRAAQAARAQRATEEQFRAMVDRAPVMLWGARPDATLHYLNRTCAEVLGLPLEALKDNGWLDAVHPDDVEQCVNTYGPAVEARVPFVAEFRVMRSDGTYRWISDAGVPEYRVDGTYAGFVGCSTDVTERRNSEDLVRKSQAVLAASHREIQELAGRLLTVHEDERRRLARELHDDLTQRLARLAIDAGVMEQAPGAPAALGPLREDLVRLSEDVHSLSYRLHPSVLDDLGLVEAIRAECDRVARRSSLQVAVDARDVPALPADAPLCLFRIVQEALSNAARHARASHISVRLSPQSDGLQLAICDDGVGFDPLGPRDHISLGLASMRERVRLVQGELRIESAPGQGTTVTAWVPA